MSGYRSRLQDPQNTTTPRKVYSVSQLTDNIKALLEDKYSIIWISGEISNLRVPPSGHAYFTLKDSKAQISAVMFRGQLRQLKFDIQDGMVLVGIGRVTVYPPRGNYQIILEYIEPQGTGALQIAFEQLKHKLAQEGLFSEESKSVLPYLPQRVGVITSPSGAVVQDILRVLKRRYYNIIIDIYPVRVQGLEAPFEIIEAIDLANRRKKNDLLILTRGGGSLEDLSPFNDEGVARAIFTSKIPVVSAVGHETDYTIADFVADTRAPTPSAAAEIIVPVKVELQDRIAELQVRLERSVRKACDQMRLRLRQINRLIIHPGKKVEDLRLHVDHLGERMLGNMLTLIRDRNIRLERARDGLKGYTPANRLEIFRSRVDVLQLKMLQLLKNNISEFRERFRTADALLRAVNPSAILERGYSITRTVPDRHVVMDAGDLAFEQQLEIQLAKGTVDVRVIQSKNKS